MGMWFSVILIVYCLVLIQTANWVEKGRLEAQAHQYMIYGLLALVGSIFALNMLALPLVLSDPAASGMGEIDVALFLVAHGLAGFLLYLGVLVVYSDEARYHLQVVAGWSQGFYNPASPVHTTAFVLSVALLVVLLMAFVAGGGTAGVAESIAGSGVALDELALTAAMWLLIAFRGVGWGTRRSLREALVRLGLRLPTRDDLTAGVTTGIALIFVALVFGFVWQVLTDPETFQQQNLAAEQLAQSINTLPLVFAVSASAAIGEEVFVRGALQPIFGIQLTSVFFVMLHSQYLFAPSMILLYIVSVAIGVLRQRHSTTAAIVAHFTYNFIPLLLSYLLATNTGGITS